MKLNINEYVSYKGFFDLRDFDLTKKEFISFWKIQDFLFDVSQRMDIYKAGFQWKDIQELAARYQVKLLKKEKKHKETEANFNAGELSK